MQKLLNINKRRLWELARAGKSAREIMEAMDIKDMTILRHSLHHVMLESGESFQVPGLS
jgi:DNA-binding CsgD family transcriptional regulator